MIDLGKKIAIVVLALCAFLLINSQGVKAASSTSPANNVERTYPFSGCSGPCDGGVWISSPNKAYRVAEVDVPYGAKTVNVEVRGSWYVHSHSWGSLARVWTYGLKQYNDGSGNGNDKRIKVTGGDFYRGARGSAPFKSYIWDPNGKASAVLNVDGVCKTPSGGSTTTSVSVKDGIRYVIAGQTRENIGSVSPHVINVTVKCAEAPWNTSATSTVSSAKVVPGDTITWTHTLNNNGPNAVTKNIYNYAMRQTNGVTSSTRYGAETTATSGKGRGQLRKFTSSYTTTTSDIGSVICEQLAWSPKAVPAQADGRSGWACATVRSDFNLYPRAVINGGSGSSVSYITAGDSVSSADIDQTIRNTGSSSDADRVTNNNAVVNEFVVKKENRTDFLGNLNAFFDQDSNGFRFGLGSWSSGDACSSWLAGKAPYVDCGRGVKYDDNGNVKYLASSTKLPDTTSVEANDDVDFGDMICRIVSIKDYNYQHSDVNERRISVPACVMVTKQPKVQFSGADVRSNNNVYTSSTLTSRGTYGSWAEFAVMSSAGTVRSTSGAALSTEGAIGQSRSEVDRNKLTFANVSPTGIAAYGNFGGTFTSPTISARFPSSTLPALPASVQVSSLAGGTHTRTGDLTLDGGEINQKVVIRSTDTVTITGDITYANGPYTSSSAVPQLVIIAKNIIINDNVGRVDAWLVADTDGGYVSTCGAVSGSNWSDGLNATVCAGRLTVNGPIIADHLYLKRTFGESGNQPDNNPGTPAEIINLRPDAYLYGSSQSQSTGSIRTMNIKELPPRF